MAKEKVNIKKEVFEKNRYTEIIDTQFSQLLKPTSPEETSIPTVEEFFDNYNDIFYDIPKEGEIDSHRYLLEKSSQYLGVNENDPVIQQLQQEITELRRELLNQSQINNDLATQLETLGKQFETIQSINGDN